MATPLFLPRRLKLASLSKDLDYLTIGIVNDMYSESINVEYKGYAQFTTQSDFNELLKNLYIFCDNNVLKKDAYLSLLYSNGDFYITTTI